MSKQPYDPMDLKSLRCFETMAKHGSLTRASIELGISDSAVSQRVRSLENHLGVKLYEARGGKVRLTEAGERTKDLAMHLFDKIDEFEEEISDYEKRGAFVLSAEASLQRYHLPEIVDTFVHTYPLARLRLLNRRPAETVELVRRNEVDLGIIHERSIPSEVRFYPWRVFKSYVLIPRGHPLARRRVPTIEDILNDETLLRYPQIVGEIDGKEENRIRQGLQRLDLPYNVALEVGNIETVKYYVARGHGIAVVSGVCISQEDGVKFHKIEIPEAFDGETAYGVILRKDKHISSALRGLLNLLEVSNLDSKENT